MFTTEMEIDNFLEEYKRSRVIVESSVRASLNRALEFEQKFQKYFYEFTIDEAIEMYKAVHGISVVALQNMNLLMKHASRWFIDAKGLETQSIYESVTKENLLKCVDENKKKSMILTYEDFIDIQNQLLNYTDKAIILMLWLGAGSNWLKELTFFDMSQASKKRGALYFRTGKVIPISDADYEVIKQGCEEDELMSFGTTARVARVISHGIFKQRTNALSASDDPSNELDLERRFRFIQRRLTLISKDLGVQLTSGAIQNSGMLYYLKKGVVETGLSFREYVKTSEAKELARRYDLYTDFYSQVIVEKFEQYF